MKIALVGTCPSSRFLAPFNDPSWEIWVCSADNAYLIPRVSAWFEIHGDWGYQDAPKWESRYLEWLNKQAFPVYVQQIDLIPNGVLFPAKELIEEFGPYWFTSTMAWMLAFALKRGVKELGIFGADMSTRDEYLIQRPGLHYWMEVATRRGVSVYIPDESDLLQPPPLYGYSEASPMGRKLVIRQKEMTVKASELRAEIKHLEAELNHVNGVLDSTEYERIVWTGINQARIPVNLLEK